MGFWWKPKRFVALAIEKSRAFLSASLVAFFTLFLGVAGAIFPVDAANAAVLSGTVQSAGYGPGSGGSYYDNSCAADYVITGFNTNYATNISVICSQVSSDGTINAGTATRLDTARPDYGTYALRCSANKVVIKINVYGYNGYSPWLNEMQIVCANASDTTTGLETWGSTGANGWSYTCPAGTLATHVISRLGGDVDALGLSCQAIANPSPGVSSFTNTTSTPTNLNSLDFSLSFTVSVSGVDSTDFTMTGTSGTNGTWTKTVVSGSGAGPYVIRVANSSAIAGTVGLSVSLAGISNASTGATGSASISSSSVTIDLTAPTITLTAPTSPNKNATLTFTVTSSEVLTGLATTDFSTVITTGTGCVIGTLGSVAGSGPYTYSLTVTGCSDPAQVYISLAALSSTDAAGNAAPATAVTTSAR